MTHLCDEIYYSACSTIASEKNGLVSVNLFVRGAPRTPGKPTSRDDWIDTDPVRLRQILNALMANAIKFTDTGTITLSYDFTTLDEAGIKRSIVFRVSDTGIGIPESEQARIFERFHKVEHTDRLYPGSGLGLSICKGLVQMMNGSIHVKSTPGMGTAFTMTIPSEHSNRNIDTPIYPILRAYPQETSDIQLPEREVIQTDAAKSSWKKGIFIGVSMLVAEDEQPNWEFIQLALRPTGATVDRASDGIEALEKFRSTPYQIILLDIKMPRLDGIEVLRDIRKSGSKIPIITQTAHALPEDEMACYEAGANRFLAKPYSARDLISAIRDLLDCTRQNTSG